MPRPSTQLSFLRAAVAGQRRATAMMLAGVVIVMTGVFAPLGPAGWAVAGSGGALLFLAMGWFGARVAAAWTWVASIRSFVEDDAAACFITRGDGAIAHQNGAARRLFGNVAGQSLAAVLDDTLDDAPAVLRRLHAASDHGAPAGEEVAYGDLNARLSTQVLSTGERFWRVELCPDRTPRNAMENPALPLMTVSASGKVLDANEAMRRLIGKQAHSLDRILADLPLRPGGCHTIRTREGPCRATVLELGQADGRRHLCILTGCERVAPDGRLFDALPVPLLRIAETGEVLLCNRLARNLLEIEEGAHPNLSELVTGLGRPIADWLADAAQGKGASRPEVVRAARPAMDVFLQIALGRITDDDGVSLIAVMHDATELKTLEAQFVQSQKMQAIGQLAGGIAHDFNNLLTAIRGHCDLLMLTRDAGHPDYADLEQINQNANRAASLVSQLLAYSRKQTLRLQLLDLRETLSDLAHLLNRLVGEKITLALTHDPDLKMVRADKRQLEQVLMNLVVNARDAMPNGGTIRISTEVRTLDVPLGRERATVPAGEYVVVSVSDEGVGILPDKLPKIFEPFFTTKRTGEGTGLGLSTAYGIVKQTGGYIFCDSIPGGGSTFTIYLAAHDRPAPPTDVASPATPAPPTPVGQGVVLLVEDEAPVRAFAGRALRMRGFTVIEAENAEEALERLEDRALEVDVFVTDVIMPGMDGPSWVSKALETRPGTRVVFVSGYAEDSLAEARLAIPNAVFLPKPFSLSDLTATVEGQAR